DRHPPEIGVGVDRPDEVEPGRGGQGDDRGLDDALRRSKDRDRLIWRAIVRSVTLNGRGLSQSLMKVQSAIP
ncbi:MAG: hypothetical protein K0R13_3397, partial [Propionibacteriaceae bacterium]|nr:hypothetical protein [Propionibacteriaceae bacterium]